MCYIHISDFYTYQKLISASSFNISHPIHQFLDTSQLIDKYIWSVGKEVSEKDEWIEIERKWRLIFISTSITISAPLFKTYKWASVYIFHSLSVCGIDLHLKRRMEWMWIALQSFIPHRIYPSSIRCIDSIYMNEYCFKRLYDYFMVFVFMDHSWRCWKGCLLLEVMYISRKMRIEDEKQTKNSP